jgi:hypothetical protein
MRRVQRRVAAAADEITSKIIFVRAECTCMEASAEACTQPMFSIPSDELMPAFQLSAQFCYKSSLAGEA